MIALMKVFLSNKFKQAIVITTAEEYYRNADMPTDLVFPRVGGTPDHQCIEQFMEKYLNLRTQSELSFSLDDFP